jgi:hypothetical protein
MEGKDYVFLLYEYVLCTYNNIYFCLTTDHGSTTSTIRIKFSKRQV